mgnify:CR=1 FL=1
MKKELREKEEERQSAEALRAKVARAHSLKAFVSSNVYLMLFGVDVWI